MSAEVPLSVKSASLAAKRAHNISVALSIGALLEPQAAVIPSIRERGATGENAGGTQRQLTG